MKIGIPAAHAGASALIVGGLAIGLTAAAVMTFRGWQRRGRRISDAAGDASHDSGSPQDDQPHDRHPNLHHPAQAAARLGRFSGFTASEITWQQWLYSLCVVVLLAGVGKSYQLFNTNLPPPKRWPTFFAWDPKQGSLVQPVGGDQPYQTFVLKSWADEYIPFVPLLALPYISFLLIVPVVVPLLNLAVSSFYRFLTVSSALIVSQLVMNLAYWLFQTNVLREHDPGGGINGYLVKKVWGVDQPFNGYPSGHCAWTTIAICSLFRLRKKAPVAAWVLIPWLTLVYPATVCLRQHYLMDVYAGITLGFACYWGVMFGVELPRLVPRDEIERSRKVDHRTDDAYQASPASAQLAFA